MSQEARGCSQQAAAAAAAAAVALLMVARAELATTASQRASAEHEAIEKAAARTLARVTPSIISC